MCFGPASPDAGVELLRQLFLQCRGRVRVEEEPNHTTARKPVPLNHSILSGLGIYGDLGIGEGAVPLCVFFVGEGLQYDFRSYESRMIYY